MWREGCRSRIQNVGAWWRLKRKIRGTSVLNDEWICSFFVNVSRFLMQVCSHPTQEPLLLFLLVLLLLLPLRSGETGGAQNTESSIIRSTASQPHFLDRWFCVPSRCFPSLFYHRTFNSAIGSVHKHKHSTCLFQYSDVVAVSLNR